MLTDKAKEMFAKLDLDIPAVAIKYVAVPPEGVKKSEEKLAFCQFARIAQETEEQFYITVDNDSCYGKVPLGMIPPSPVTASGQAGFDFEVYKSPAACRRLYQNLPTLVPGSIHAVWYSPVSICDFDPDLIVVFAEIEKADILMRATSYISGDLWESKTSPVLSCAWMYAYPLISGKVNHLTTGFYHGLRRRKTYGEGLRMISIPFNKIYEVVQALEEMPWKTIGFREDEESKDELQRRVKGWQEMAELLDTTCDLH